MRRPVLAQTPLRPRARLNLAPRLHADETLSSWLERFAARYGMSIRELFLWLGYPDFFQFARNPFDLDVVQPADLAGVLAAHTGIGADVIAAHGIDGASALTPERRRAFCPECWVEEAPYRRFEWAHGWSLVCPRHRRLLSERPRAQGPFVHWSEEAWSEFYCDTGAWRDLRPSWQSEPWTRICAALGVEPHAEFLRAWPWLLELSQPAEDSGRIRDTNRSAYGGCDVPQDPHVLQDSRGPRDLPVDTLTVKQDLALYGMIRFWGFSLVQTLDGTISSDDLMQDTSGGWICGVRTPHAPYWIRLFAATAARHLWVRLTQGQWRCARYPILEQVVQHPERWNDEDWWLEQRLRTWPPPLATSGRELFRRTNPFVMLPPWERCRECLRGVQGAIREALTICLPESWRCIIWDPSVASELNALIAQLIRPQRRRADPPRRSTARRPIDSSGGRSSGCGAR